VVFGGAPIVFRNCNGFWVLLIFRNYFWRPGGIVVGFLSKVTHQCFRGPAAGLTAIILTVPLGAFDISFNETFLSQDLFNLLLGLLKR
jgi:hypothetical protein